MLTLRIGNMGHMGMMSCLGQGSLFLSLSVLVYTIYVTKKPLETLEYKKLQKDASFHS